jgi:hypothetical protein
MEVEKVEVTITENELAYLRTRSIFIATPCFGGQMSYTYTGSLLALTSACSKIGIEYVAFLRSGESLISRARNFMVSEFLNTTNYTDFFFIDADMGFDVQDFISMLLRDEEIIGVPYPRKQFGWARLIDFLKNHHCDIPVEDIDKLTSDFVYSCVPGQSQPTSINLREVLEVRDAGTGLMRIKREVFGKIREAFPDRMFMPFPAENGSDSAHLPTYMYFQPEIDPDYVADRDPDYVPDHERLPHYLSEDYAFCRLARRAGLKVHIAPWVKTTHTGIYTYKGDLETVAKHGGAFRFGGCVR